MVRFFFLVPIGMNKVLVSFALFALALSAATPKEESFSVSSFFQGSWIIAKRVIDVNTGDVIGESELLQYNVTKTDENEYDIFPLEKNSFHRSQDANQVVLIPSSSFDCEIRQYSSQTDRFETVATLNFIPVLANESFVGVVHGPYA